MSSFFHLFIVRIETPRRPAIVSTLYQHLPFFPHQETIRARSRRGPGFNAAASRDWLMKSIGVDPEQIGMVIFIVDILIAPSPTFWVDLGAEVVVGDALRS